MFNLIIKDMVIQKKTFLYAFLYTIVAATGFFTMSDNGIILYEISPMVIVYLFITYAASYDDKNKSEFVLNSLPLKRNEIVMSKYIAVFAFAAIGVIYSITVGFICKTTGLLPARSISLFDIVSVLAFVCILSSIYFPVYFKLGGIKANQIINILLVVCTALPLIAIANGDVLLKVYNSIINTTSLSLNFLALILGSIMFLISLMVSIWIYNNREF